MSLITFFDEPVVYLSSPRQSSYQRQLARRQQQAYQAYRALAQQQANLLNAFSDIFDSVESQVRAPKVDLREVANGYVLEAELPGVRKEDLNVTIGEGGKTIRIEGRSGQRGAADAAQPAATEQTNAQAAAEAPAKPTEAASTTAPGESTQAPTAEATSAPQGQTATAEANEQPGAAPTEPSYASTFSQTFSLPRPVDGSRVVAKLADGVLTLVVPFLEDTKSMRITVD